MISNQVICIIEFIGMISFNKLGNYGRFGNQLFQYAYLRTQAKRLGTTFYCPSWAGDLIFELKDEKEKAIYPETQLSFDDRFHGFSPEATKIKDNTDITGFFQSPKYFSQEDINNWFVFKESFFSAVNRKYKHIDFEECVGIHLRLGDYTSPQFVFYVPYRGYFQNALRIVGPKAHILIFSDDPIQAKKYLKKFANKDNLIFIEGNTEIEDFYLLSKCHDTICSSSSFSWWAAYLNKSSRKKVIVPASWFLPGGKTVNNDIFVDGWIKIRAHMLFFGSYYGQYIPIVLRIFSGRVRRSFVILKEKGPSELLRRIKNRKLII